MRIFPPLSFFMASRSEHSDSFFSWRYIALSLSLSLIGLIVVLYYTYTPGTLERLQFKRLPGLVIAFIVALLRMWFSAQRLRHLSEKAFSRIAAFRVSLVWDFASAVSPSTVGGAPAATYAMSKEDVSLGKSTAIVLYSVLLDQIWFAISIPVLIFLGFYFDIVPESVGIIGESVMVVMYLVLLGYAAMLSYAVLINPASLRPIISSVFSIPVLRRFKDSVLSEIGNLEKTAFELKEQPPRFVAEAFFWTFWQWMGRLWIPVIVILSFGHSDPFLAFLRSFAMNLAGFFMPTPGGSGGIEGLFAVFMASLMERASYIGLAVLMWRFMTYYINIILGIFAAMWYLKPRP